MLFCLQHKVCKIFFLCLCNSSLRTKDRGSIGSAEAWNASTVLLELFLKKP